MALCIKATIARFEAETGLYVAVAADKRVFRFPFTKVVGFQYKTPEEKCIGKGWTVTLEVEKGVLECVWPLR